jgi:hypothetical protein
LNSKKYTFGALISTLGLAAFLNLTYVLYRYVTLGTYLDHAEPDTAIMAWRYASGLALYYPIDAAEGLITAYGPLLYVLVSLPLKLFGPSIEMSKLAPTFACGFSAVVFALYVWRRFGWAYVGLAIIPFTGFILIVAPVSFWVRPESFTVLLVTIAVLSTLAMDKQRPWVTALIVAACAGLAMNLKIHAFIYFVPLVFRHCTGNWIRVWPVMAAVSILLFLSPFALPNISPFNYINGIAGVIGERPLQTASILKALKWSPMFLAPGAILLLAWLSKAKKPSRADLTYFGVFAGCLILAYYPSSVQGSTWRQLLPFFPLTIDLFLRFLPLLDGKRALWIIGVVVFPLAIAIIAVTPQKRVVTAFTGNSAWIEEAGRDIKTIMDRYPNQTIQMGYGEASQIGYPTTYLRPLFAFAGHAVTLSSPSSMERQFAGRPMPPAKLEWIKSCKTQIWVIPDNNRPFAMVSFLAEGRAFPESLEAAFIANYQPRESVGKYKVWSCKK